MELDRFKALAAAYGARPARWPKTERAAAEALMARMPDACAAVLGDEADLDGLLDGWRADAPSPDLRGAVLAGAPIKGQVKGGSRRPRVWEAWLPGAGLAAIGVAGVICGATLFSFAAADVGSEAMVAAAAADDPSGWSALISGGGQT